MNLPRSNINFLYLFIWHFYYSPSFQPCFRSENEGYITVQTSYLITVFVWLILFVLLMYMAVCTLNSVYNSDRRLSVSIIAGLQTFGCPGQQPRFRNKGITGQWMGLYLVYMTRDHHHHLWCQHPFFLSSFFLLALFSGAPCSKLLSFCFTSVMSLCLRIRAGPVFVHFFPHICLCGFPRDVHYINTDASCFCFFKLPATFRIHSYCLYISMKKCFEPKQIKQHLLPE